jgi:hypothetical protein
MGILRRKVPSHLVPIHPDNATKKDWIILLEAGTIVGPSPERLRVARSTLERRIVKKYNILLERSISSSWRDTIRESMPCISVPSSTGMTLIRSSFPSKARKSED